MKSTQARCQIKKGVSACHASKRTLPVAFWCTGLYGLSTLIKEARRGKYIHHSCLPQSYVVMMLSYSFIRVYVSLSVTCTMPLIFENLMYVIIMSYGKFEVLFNEILTTSLVGACYGKGSSCV